MLVYAAAFAATAVTTYLFNAILGRKLDAQDFATFVALVSILLVLTGPSTALFGGGAMASARTGEIPRMPWRSGLLVLALAAAVVGFLPGGDTLRAAGWCGLSAVLLICSSWNRGLLVGRGRLAFTGGTMFVEGLARIGFAVALVARGYRVGGAMAGLTLGVATGLLLAWAGLPRRGGAEGPPVSPEVWLSIIGLFFIGVVQYIDVVAVRVASSPEVGAYAAASSLARIAMYAQMPAAAYAIRRTAMVGPRMALRRVIPLALGPALVALAVLEVLPSQLLSVTFGGRYQDAAGLVRILGVAMLAAGAAIVLINVCLGAGRVGWVWSATFVATLGSAIVFAVALHVRATAIAMVAVQWVLLAVAAAHVHRLVATARGGLGGVLILNWRDTGHPQGGGSEVFVREVATRLRRSGRPVTIFCASHAGAPREEMVDGVRFVRRGSWRTVYLWAGIYHLRGRFGPHDVVVDVQNAVPFFSPVYCGRPVVVLVHHVHREQWGMFFGRRGARAGWWVESRLAPILYRRAAYVTVSEASKAALIELGVGADRIAVVRNGSPDGSTGASPVTKTHEPTIVFLGRLVPHKRIDLLLDAAHDLRAEFPSLSVRIVGHGGWDGRLREACIAANVQDIVSFDGFVDAETKRRILAESWVMALPSVMEGWGLAVVEAAVEGTPSVAFRVGGLQESIIDGSTGLLVDDYAAFVDALRRMLASAPLRAEMGAAARRHATSFTWDRTAAAFGAALDHAAATARCVPGADRSSDPTSADPLTIPEPVQPV